MTPPTKRTVLSFDIRPNEQHILKAEIDAALPLQKLARKRKIKPSDPTCKPIQFTESSHDVNWQCACHVCVQSKLRAEVDADPTQHHSPLRPKRTIGGTVKGELITAKDYIKKMPKKQLDRLRTRKTKREVQPRISTYSDISKSPIDPIKHSSQVDEIDPFPTPRAGYAELLGSEPQVVHQMDDGEEQMKCGISTRHSLPPAYGDERMAQGLSPVSLIRSDEASVSSKLQSRACNCYNCHKRISGGDPYDFCDLCPPESRLLCMTCADQGGCSRHRAEQIGMQMPSSSRGSPAPSYNERRAYENVAERAESPLDAAVPSQTRLVRKPFIQVQKARGCTNPVGHGHIAETTVDTADISHINLATTCTRPNQQTSGHEAAKLLKREHADSHLRDASLLVREATLREQQAVLREQQITNRELNIREQEISLRERINQLRDRDAIVIQGLQQWCTELAKSVQIGAQFQTSKDDKFDADTPTTPVSRAASILSNASDISLRHDKLKHAPNEMVSQAMAEAEATFNVVKPDNSNVRSHTQKRKKNDTGGAAKPTTPSRQSSSINPSSSRGDAGEGDAEDDEERDEEDPMPFKKPRQTPPGSAAGPRLFACPYCKHDRDRYSPRNRNQFEKQYRGCAGRDLHDIPRLKQHLRRVHWRPINHCPRCWNDCKSPAGLMEHHEQDDRCVKQACPFPERMDKQQQDKIHVKRPRVDQVQQWYEIYSVLFPDSPLPESPYADEDDSTSPTIPATPATATHDEAAQKLGKLFSDRLEKHKDQLTPQLLDLVRQLHNESVVELFAGLSLTPSPSPRTYVPMTPIIVVSPVQPAPDTKTQLEHQRLFAPVNECSKTVQKDVKARVHVPIHSVPRLGDPTKLELGPALPGQTSRPTSRTKLPKTDNVTNPPRRILQPSPIVEDLVSTHVGPDAPQSLHQIDDRYGSENRRQFPMNRLQHVEPPAEVSSTVHFPGVAQHVMEDTGYDGQSQSYESGDDRFAMGPAQESVPKVNRKFHMNTLPLPESPRPQREFKLSLDTLKDLTPEDINTTQQLQHRKSIASNLDSGYGSGNSERPVPRMALGNINQDEEMTDIGCYPPAGHATFLEELEMWEIGNINPWHTADDIGWAQ